jgi:hypothetical protein
MTSIDRTGALAALIRTHMATQREPKQPLAMGHLSPAVTVKDSSVQARGHTEPASRPDVQRQSWVTQQVKHLLPDDPRNKRKAFRIFLESILGQEFGSELIGSGSFNQLVGQVLVQMEGDPELVLAMDEAGKELLLEAGVLKTNAD